MMDGNDDTAEIDADDGYIDAGKITLKELFNASAGLDILVERSTWTAAVLSMAVDHRLVTILILP